MNYYYSKGKAIMTRIFLHCTVSNKEQKLKVILEKK